MGRQAPASCRPLWFSTMRSDATCRPKLADRRCALCASLSMPLFVTKQKGMPASCTCDKGALLSAQCGPLWPAGSLLLFFGITVKQSMLAM